MPSLPNEIINHILSYRGIHPIADLIKYEIEECYYKDCNPYIDNIERNNRITLSFSFFEWYFTISRLWRRYNRPVYKLTPKINKICYGKLHFLYQKNI